MGRIGRPLNKPTKPYLAPGRTSYGPDSPLLDPWDSTRGKKPVGRPRLDKAPSATFTLSMPQDLFARLHAALKPDENRSAFICAAVEARLK